MKNQSNQPPSDGYYDYKPGGNPQMVQHRLSLDKKKVKKIKNMEGQSAQQEYP